MEEQFSTEDLKEFEAMFTLYQIVKRSVAESVPDRASVHTRTAAFEGVSALEQYCSAPLLKVERSVSDRFLRRSESSLNTFIGAEIATGSQKLQQDCRNCNGIAEIATGLRSHWERFGTISAPQQKINSCSYCTGATFETEQKTCPVQCEHSLNTVRHHASRIYASISIFMPYKSRQYFMKLFSCFWLDG